MKSLSILSEMLALVYLYNFYPGKILYKKIVIKK